MFAESFVHFLLVNDLLTQKQATEALSRKVAKVRPAIVAVFEKLITEEEARRIQQLQITEDMPFGFLAVREGFLTNDQLSSLLGRQSRADLEIMQILSDKGFLTMEEIMQNFLEFQKFYELSDEDYAGIVENKPEVYVRTIGNVTNIHSFFGQYTSLFLSTFFKCVDTFIRLEKVYVLPEVRGEVIVTVQCDGDKDVTLGLICDDMDTFLEFSSRFVRKRLKNYDADAEDSVKEFMNMVGGVFITVVEKTMGLDIDIHLPNLKIDSFIKPNMEITALDLFSGKRKITLFQY